MMKQNIAPTHRGFTLIELLVVIAIMGVTLTIGLPSLQSTIASNRLTASANDMLSALQYARSESIKRIRQCGVIINDSSSWGTFIELASNVVQNYKAASGVTLTVTSSGAFDLTPTYNPDGRLASATPVVMRFSSTATTDTRTLTIATSGRITITNP